MKLFKKAVLIIHGYAGGTYDQEPLALSLQQYWNLDVYQFTLPGHQKRTLKKVSYQDWIDKSEEILNQIKSYGYNTVYVVGHSMGGVIASYLTQKYSFVKKLVLVAPAFVSIATENDLSKPESFKTAVEFLKKVDKAELYTRVAKMQLSSLKEFKKLVKDYKDCVNLVKVPVLMIQGLDDELVPYKYNVDIFDNLKTNNKKLILLENTTHDVFKDEGCEKAIEEIIKFFR